MLRRILVTAALLTCGGAWAQSSCVVSSSAPNYAPYVGQSAACSVDTNGNIRTTATGSSSVTANQGTPNTAANGWPVYLEFGGVALPLGQALSAASVPVVLPAAQITTLTPPTSVSVTQATAASLNATVVGTGTFPVQSTLQAGSALVGKVGIDQTTPGTTNGVTIAPSSASTVGIAPIVSASVESNHVFKGSAGNLYSLSVTNGTASGYLLLFNATTAPADGAVTPLACYGMPSANSTFALSFGSVPAYYSTGITAVFSTTGCFTKTASATAFFSGQAQ